MNLLQSLKKYLDGDYGQKTETEIIQPELNIGNDIGSNISKPPTNRLYIGCYDVDPTKPQVMQEIGTVQNQLDCIKSAVEQGYKYMALQNGNQCFATNEFDFKNTKNVPQSNCNMVCDETDAGYCGGVLQKQLYASSSVIANEAKRQQNKESFKHLENFINTNKEMKNISKNIKQNDMMCEEPINKYNLLLILLIFILLGYLLFELVYKNNN
jgi:hypothetical protein